jgi:hypothetical protein
MADEETQDSQDTQETQTQTPATDGQDLGDNGKKALDAERRDRRAAEKRSKELEAELEKFRQASLSDQEKAVEAARKEAGDGVRAELMRERVADKIDAAVAGRFSDDEAAALILAKSGDFIADGQVDVAAIRQAADDLVASGRLKLGSNSRFQGGGDQGPRQTEPASIDDQIREAESKGDIRTAISLKSAKLTELNK